MTASMSALPQRVDRGEVAPQAVRVQAAAEHEPVRDAQAHEIRRDRFGGRLDLVSQYRNLARRRAARHHLRLDLREGVARVQNVVDTSTTRSFTSSPGSTFQRT